VRKHHDAQLRPELGSVNHVQELNTLTQKEKERSIEVEALIKKTRQQLLILCEKHALLFSTDLCYRTQIMLLLLDGIIMEKDLLIIDGEVEIKTKRKSLKTLRKMRAISEAKADGAVSEDEKDVGFRGLRKLWDGIPTNKLSLLGLNVVLGEPVGGGDGDGGEENGENDDVTVQDDGTIPTDAAVNNMNEKQLKYWIIKI